MPLLRWGIVVCIASHITKVRTPLPPYTENLAKDESMYPTFTRLGGGGVTLD